MTIETKFHLGQRVRFDSGKSGGYRFMVGPIVAVNAMRRKNETVVAYRISFDDPKYRNGWRDWFTEDELQPVDPPPEEPERGVFI